MKKTIITLITCTMALPVFAFNFDNKFEIDANIKAQINDVISKEVKTAAEENALRGVGNLAQNSDNNIVFEINKSMDLVIRDINRNANLRKRVTTKNFVEEQKVQKQRYENMRKWDIPSKIFTYIKTNFDLQKVHHVTAVCKYIGETAIDVHFAVDMKGVIVTYHYTETPWKPSITHKIFK